LAQRIGLSESELAADRTVLVHGASPGSIRVGIHRFHELRIGAVAIHDPALAVVPDASGTGEALIGEDFLRGRRVWLSFATGHLFVSEPSAATEVFGVR
jgi:hypothetical protein